MVKKKQSFILTRRDGCLVTFVVWTMFMFLSIFRHDYIVPLVFVLISHRMALFDVDVPWNCLCSTWEHQGLTIYNRKKLEKRLNIHHQEKNGYETPWNIIYTAYNCLNGQKLYVQNRIFKMQKIQHIVNQHIICDESIIYLWI